MSFVQDFKPSFFTGIHAMSFFSFKVFTRSQAVSTSRKQRSPRPLQLQKLDGRQMFAADLGLGIKPEAYVGSDIPAEVSTLVAGGSSSLASRIVSTRSAAPRNLGDDHANNRQNATEISLGLSNTGTMNGIIERARDVDYFKFYLGGLSNTQTMRIDVAQRAGSSLDPMTRLFNAAGQQIASNDDSGDSLNSQIIMTLTRGWYFIEVSGHTSRPTGAYSVSVRPSTPANVTDDHENSRWENASRITMSGSMINTVSGTRVGTIERAGDLDLFRFDNTGTKQFTIDVTSRTGSRLDPYVDLFDARGNRIGSDDDSGTGNNSQLIRTLGTGTFYVRVRGVSSSTGDYTVAVRGVTGATDNSGRERLNLNQSHHVQDNDQTTNRRKEYVVNATRSGVFEITVAPRGFGTILRNPRIEVRDTNNRLIATSQPGRINEALLSVHLTQGVDYRISVIGTSGDGSFRLEMAG